MPRIYPLVDFGKNSPQSIYEADTTQQHPLGTRGRIGNKVFYYASSTGAALAKGTVCRIAAGTAGHESISAASAVAGATTVSATLTATSISANFYADGYFFVVDGTGSGQERRVVSHASFSSDAVATFVLDEGLETALAAGDEVTLRRNEYKSVVVTPGNAVCAVAGVPQHEVGAGSTTEQFFWVQTWGPAMAVSDASTFVEGSLVTYASSTTDDAGQVTLYSMASSASNTTITPVVLEVIAIALDPGDASDADHKWINLKLNP
jgi:hypothetical protein